MSSEIESKPESINEDPKCSPEEDNNISKEDGDNICADAPEEENRDDKNVDSSKEENKNEEAPRNENCDDEKIVDAPKKEIDADKRTELTEDEKCLKQISENTHVDTGKEESSLKENNDKENVQDKITDGNDKTANNIAENKTDESAEQAESPAALKEPKITKGKSKKKTIRLDSFEMKYNIPGEVVLDDEPVCPVKQQSVSEKDRSSPAKSRHRRRIIQDWDDAYSYKQRQMQEAQRRPDKNEEKSKELQTDNPGTVYEKIKVARKENPFLRKKINDDIESSRPVVEDREAFLEELRTQKKVEYFNDEDLYGSDDSDTELKMLRASTKANKVPQEKVNKAMESRRAHIVRLMEDENERIYEMDRRKEEIRKKSSRLYTDI